MLSEIRQVCGKHCDENNKIHAESFNSLLINNRFNELYFNLWDEDGTGCISQTSLFDKLR